jgi:outer membrane protein insertion porin family
MAPSRLACALTLLLLLTSGAGFAAGGAGAETGAREAGAALFSLGGLPVVKTGFESDAPFSFKELAPLVTVLPGAPLRPGDVRNTILALYGTGRFERVEARGRRVALTGGPGGFEGEVAAGGEGVELLFFLSPRKTLMRVSFTGNLEIPDSDLYSRVSLRRGDKVDDEALEAGRKRLEDYYSFRGYPAAEITTGYGYDGLSPEIDVVFAIREGAQLSIRDIRLTGDPPFGRARALSLVGSRIGEALDGERVDGDLLALRARLKEEGYFFSPVTSAVDRSDLAHGAILDFRVERGDHYDLAVEGCAQRDAGAVLNEVRRAFEAGSSPASAQSAAEEKILDGYRAEGFPFAALAWREERGEGGRVSLTLVVSEGKKAVFGKATVEGALSLTPAEIEDALGLVEGAPFAQKRAEEARGRLEARYRGKGFLSARPVLSPVAFAGSGEGLVADVRLTVQEGVRSVVGELSLAGGEDAVAPDLLLRDLGVRAGSPYVPDEMARGRQAILDHLAGEGYIFSRVEAAEAFTDSRRRVAVRVQVDPGPRVTSGSLTVTGNRHLDPRILKVAADLPPGTVLTPERILDAQKRMYRLGMVESVEVRLADEGTPAAVKDLVIDVRERNRLAMGLRLGYSNDELFRGEVSLTHRNVGGKARSLTFLGRAGSMGSLASATYGIPWFLDRPIDLSLSISDQIDIKKSFTRDASIIALTLSREFSPTTTGILTYSFGGTRLTEVAPGAILSPEDQGKTTIGSIAPLVVLDTRDDKFEPRRGSLADLRFEVAAPQLGSQTDYWRVEGSFRRFYPAGEKTVLAFIARAGVVESFGRSPEVIIDKRLFLGGQNSVRGYALDTLGPVDAAGKPLGGNFLANLDAEVRFPLYKSLGGVVFVDSGAVWLEAAPHDDRTPRVSTGAGLRWGTPIGPFSLDYGRKLNPALKTEDMWFLHFSIGHAF